MKEVHDLRHNFLAAWNEDNVIEPRVEVILITSEPQYHVDPADTVQRQRLAEQTRFVSSPVSLREIANRLTLLAEQAEQLPLTTRTPQKPSTP